MSKISLNATKVITTRCQQGIGTASNERNCDLAGVVSICICICLAMEGPWELEGRTCLARLGKQTPLNNLAIRVAVNVWLLNDTSAASALAPIGDIADWDTSGATDMSDLFNCNRAGVRTDACTAFNANISAWQTAGVTNLERAFKNAAKFNQPLGPWQTAAVTSMRGLFDGAAAFDQGVNMWSTAKVVDIGTMFSGAEAFDQVKPSPSFACMHGRTLQPHQCTAMHVRL